MNELLKKLAEKDILLEVVDGRLRVGTSGGEVDAGLLGEIRENREQLIGLLTGKEPIPGRAAGWQTISPAPVAMDYCLSSGQQRIWTLSQLPGGNRAYNMPGVCILEGVLDQDALEFAFDSLVQRHEILRTFYVMNQEGEVRQVIEPAENISFRMGVTVIDDENGSEEIVNRHIGIQLETEFDLGSPPLIRVHLYKTGAGKWILTCIIHHIAGDGWSMQVLIRELLLFYHQHRTGGKPILPPLSIQYKDYASWEQGQVSGPALARQKEYWRQRIGLGVVPMKLSLRKRPAVFTHAGAAVNYTIDAATAEGLASLAARYNGTLFMSLLFFLRLLLWRYTGERKIMMGTSFAGRSLPELHGQIGLYLNNLPLIGTVDPSFSLRELFEDVREMVVGALGNQQYPLDRLLNDIGYKTDPGRTGPFNVFVELHSENDTSYAGSNADLRMRPWALPFYRSQFDVSYSFIPTRRGLEGTIIYSTDLFSEPEIHIMKDRLLGLMNDVLRDFDGSRRVDDISFRKFISGSGANAILRDQDLQEAF